MASSRRSRTTSSPSPAPDILSEHEVAEALGVDPRVLRRYRARGLPWERRGKTVYLSLSAAREWRERVSGIRVLADEDLKTKLARAELHRRRAQTQKLRLQRQILEDRYILRETAEEKEVRLARALRDALLALPARCAGAWANKGRKALEREIAQEMEAVLGAIFGD